jgi:taurine dioxygenase
MECAGFNVIPLWPDLGAEIVGDLRQSLSQEQMAVLRRLMDRYHLLVFRGQALGPDDQVRIVSTFGPVAPAVIGGPLHTTVNAPEGDVLPFHSDYSFTHFPLPFVSLYGVAVENDTATTAFVSGVAACAQIPAPLHQRIADRTVLHASDILCAGQRSTGPLRHDVVRSLRGGFHGVSHPAFLPHPRTSDEVLFVNEYFSVAIEGLPYDESEALLKALFVHLYSPCGVFHHHWRQGDLLIFDNVAVQHSRREGPPRTLRRVVVSPQPLGALLS